MKALQIGMTASTTSGGGLDRYFFSLLRTLPSVGVETVGLVSGNPADLAEPVPGLHSFAAGESGLLARMAGLRREFAPRVAAADVVVSHFAPYTLPILDLARSKPLVMHFHGPWKLESMIEGDSAFKGLLKGSLEKFVYRRGRRFVVLSRAFRDILKSEYAVPADRIHIVPGGVDVARFESSSTQGEARRAIGWPQNRRVVFSVRRLVKAKGLENLIEAAAIVRRKVPDVLFVIAGNGPLEPVLRREIVNLGLEDHVRLVGFIAEHSLPTAYAASDLFVVPTVALEGFGLVVVESLACGTPTLVTPIGGLPEVVSDLDPRLILRGLAPGDIADGIVAALLQSASLPLPSRTECKAYARRFDWSTIAKRIAAVYGEVV